jgi:hypothetical protein
MPQPFDHPAVHGDGDNRNFDELRREAELSLDTVRQEVRRTKQSGPTEQTTWPVARTKKTLDRMRKARDADPVVTNRLIGELAQLESELEQARKAWLLANAQKAPPTTGSGDFRNDDEVRRALLQGHQRLNETDRELGNVERSVAQSLQMGRTVEADMNDQGEDLLRVHEEQRTMAFKARETARVFKRMTMRAVYNRLFLYFIITLLVLANGLVVYFAYLKH